MSTPKRPTSDSSVNRRSFFRRIFIQGVEKLEESGQDLANRISDVSGHFKDQPNNASDDHHEPYNYEYVRYLRPPGALPSPLFESACTQCGDCITACPAQCIKVEPTPENGDTHHLTGGGYPYIIPKESPCVVCDDLSCMKVCPTEALNLVDHLEHIDMGYAVLNDQTCLRGPRGDQEECTLCAEHCPLGEAAIGLDPHHAIIEVRDGCIGCGVCESVCPTDPASIWVEPHNDY